EEVTRAPRSGEQARDLQPEWPEGGAEAGGSRVVAGAVQAVGDDAVEVGLVLPAPDVEGAVPAAGAPGDENQGLHGASRRASEVRQGFSTVQRRDLAVDVVGVRQASGVWCTTDELRRRGPGVDITGERPAGDLHEPSRREPDGLSPCWGNLG